MTNVVSLSNLEEIHDPKYNQSFQFVDNDTTNSIIFDFADSLYDSDSSGNNCVSNTKSDWNLAPWSLNENTHEDFNSLLVEFACNYGNSSPISLY